MSSRLVSLRTYPPSLAVVVPGTAGLSSHYRHPKLQVRNSYRLKRGGFVVFMDVTVKFLSHLLNKTEVTKDYVGNIKIQ